MKCFDVHLNLHNSSGKLYITSYNIGKPIVIFKNLSPHSKSSDVGFKTIDIKPSDLKDKSIYRYPKLTLPRNKMDVLKEKYNLSVIRSKDDADYKVVSIEYVESLLSKKWGTTILLSDFEEYVKSTIQDWEYCTLTKINDIRSKLSIDEKCGITLRNNLSWSQRSDPKHDILENAPTTNYGVFEIDNEDEETIKDVLQSSNLILDTALCSMTTEDSIILTETDYHNISKMIESKSSDNINLALELLANSNVEKSIDVIGLLFYLNYNYLKDLSTNWQSINVKTLRKRFTEFIPHGQINVYYYDRLVKSLIKEKSLTVFAFKVISLNMLNHLTKSVGFNEESVFDLKVEDIKLKSEYQKCLVLNDCGQEVIESLNAFRNALPF